jgi:hypothetical protein
MASRQPTQDDQEHERLDLIYGTILACIVIIALSWVVFFVAATSQATWSVGATKDSYVNIGWAVIAAWFVVLAAAYAFSSIRFKFISERKTPWSVEIRRGWLTGITSAIIVLLGAMVVLSGGSVNSGFSHFLIATGSIGVLLAKETWVRTLILAMAFVVYAAGLGGYLQPIVPIEQVRFWNYFNGASVLITVILAMIAASTSSPADIETVRERNALPESGDDPKA